MYWILCSRVFVLGMRVCWSLVVEARKQRGKMATIRHMLTDVTATRIFFLSENEIVARLYNNADIEM